MPLDPVASNQQSQQQKKHRKPVFGAAAIGLGLFGLAAIGGVSYLAFGGGAYRVTDLPNARAENRFVIDKAGVLGPVAGEINKVGQELFNRKGVRIVVVTVPKTKVDPQAFVADAQNRWTGGRGTVVLLTTKGRRTLRFATGHVAKAQGLTNERMQQIADQVMLPTLRQGNVTLAVVNGVREIASSVGAATAAANMPRHVRHYRSYYVGSYSVGASMLWVFLVIGGLVVLSSLGWGTCYTMGWGWYGPAYGYYGGYGYGYGYGPGVYMDGGMYVDGGVYADGGVGMDVGGGYDGGGGGGDCSSDCGGGDW